MMTGSFGQRFSQARLAREETLEDVAFRTRISVHRLADMENDDLSNFANLTYARGFLKLYSRYLGVDITEYLDQFDTSELASVSGHEYVQTANAVHNLPTLLVVKDPPNPRLWLALAAAAAAIVLPVLWVKFKPREDEVPRETPPPQPSLDAAGARPAPAPPADVPAAAPDPAVGEPSAEGAEVRPALPAVSKVEVVPEDDAAVPAPPAELPPAEPPPPGPSPSGPR